MNGRANSIRSVPDDFALRLADGTLPPTALQRRDQMLAPVARTIQAIARRLSLIGGDRKSGR